MPRSKGSGLNFRMRLRSETETLPQEPDAPIIEAIKKEIKPNPDCQEFPDYQCRYFTGKRITKAREFLDKTASNSIKYGLIGSSQWLQGLLEAIDEPGIISLDNVTEWVEKYPSIFSVSTSLKRTRISSTSNKGQKKVKLEEDTKETKGDEDNSVDSLFDLIVTQVENKALKIEIKEEDNILNENLSPLFDNLDDLPSPRWDSLIEISSSPLPILSLEEIKQSLMEIESMGDHFENNVAPKLEKMKDIGSKIKTEKVVKKEDQKESEELPDSGFSSDQTSEMYETDFELVEIGGGTPAQRFSRVLQDLNGLVKAVEDWKEILNEPGNVSGTIAPMLNELRQVFEKIYEESV